MTASPSFAAEYCQASVYSTRDRDQNGTQTASGIPLNDSLPSVAHKRHALGSRLAVTNLANGKTQTFTVLDRGPYHGSRCIDLSIAAAILLGCDGLCHVKVAE